MNSSNIRQEHLRASLSALNFDFDPWTRGIFPAEVHSPNVRFGPLPPPTECPPWSGEEPFLVAICVPEVWDSRTTVTWPGLFLLGFRFGLGDTGRRYFCAFCAFNCVHHYEDSAGALGLRERLPVRSLRRLTLKHSQHIWNFSNRTTSVRFDFRSSDCSHTRTRRIRFPSIELSLLWVGFQISPTYQQLYWENRSCVVFL